MINPEVLFNALKKRSIGFFAGVPDSLLSNFCAYVDDNAAPGEHVITANEGNAVAMAIGYHLSTGNTGLVYMQNSGLGNAVNPLTSLADAEVYRIPLLMVIGWRGEPGVSDEPQHVKQGRITPSQLEILNIPYWILDANSHLDETLENVFFKLGEIKSPVALLVRKDAFSKYKTKKKGSQLSTLQREEALREVLSLANPEDLVVSTTGKTSREVFELRAERGEAQRDFLTVGGMGHTSSIALGVALGCPQKRVLCLDGDGSLLMHMGAMPIIGDLKPTNFIHVLLNNSSHESVGGQPTVAGNVDFAAIAKASGYSNYHVAHNKESLHEAWKKLNGEKGPVLFEIKITTGSRDNLGRPTSTPEENKRKFMEAVNG